MRYGVHTLLSVETERSSQGRQLTTGTIQSRMCHVGSFQFHLSEYSTIGFFLFHFYLIWTVECGTTHRMQQIQQRAHRCVVARALLIPPFPPSHCTMQPRTSPHQSNHLYCPCSPRPNTCPSHPPTLSRALPFSLP